MQELFDWRLFIFSQSQRQSRVSLDKYPCQGMSGVSGIGGGVSGYITGGHCLKLKFEFEKHNDDKS